MLSDEQLRILGDALFFGLLAEPFFHVGTDALMSREYGKAAIAYFIGSIPAMAGLIVLGILSLGPLTPSTIGHWIQPVVVNPYYWLMLWFILLVSLGGPRFVERIKLASTTAVPSLEGRNEDSTPALISSQEALTAFTNASTGKTVGIDESTPHAFDLTAQMPKPSIIESGTEFKPLGQMVDGTFYPMPWESEWEWMAYVQCFNNEPNPPRPADDYRGTLHPVCAAKRVITRITYFIDQYEGIERQVNFGTWLNVPSAETSFAVGDVRYLILAICHRRTPDEWRAVEDHRNTAYETLGVRIIPLEYKKVIIRIRLLVDGVAQDEMDEHINFADFKWTR
jgi:hypothetical protein